MIGSYLNYKISGGVLKTKRKPDSYYTKGKGINREVHPVFLEPQGHKSKSRFEEPSRKVAVDSHTQREIAELHSRRSARARRVDESLRAPIAESKGDWTSQPNRRDVEGVDLPKRKGQKQPKKKGWKYGVLWRNTEGKVGYSITKASSKTEAYENAKKYPLFKEVLSVKHESESDFRQELKAHAPQTESTSKQWNRMSIESRKKIMKRANLNQKWADRKFDDLPQFVRKDLYSITAGTHRSWKKKPTVTKEQMERARKLKAEHDIKQKEAIKEYRSHIITGDKKEPRMGGAFSYNKATGWTQISFPDKPPKEVREEMKSHGFRYRPRSKTWAAKWTTEREDFATGLVGEMTTVNIKPNWARKAENASEQARKHGERSDESYDKAHKKLGAIPFGQPILVGHHSEKRHRSDLHKIDRLEKKGREESEKADKYKRRAERYGRKATGENPVTVHNRIRKLEADKRRLQRELEVGESGRDTIYHSGKISEKRKQDIKRWINHYDSRLEIERENYKASGGLPTDKIKINDGDRVKTRWGHGTVGRVSKNTVRVKLDPMSNGREVTIYGDSKGYSKLDKTDILGKVDVE